MDTDGKRRQVTFEQLTALLEFLKEHQELAKGLSRGRRGKVHTLKIWNLCSKKMNAIKDGAVKDGKGWSKYWCDWKYRVRRRALELRAAKYNNSPPEGIVPLSTMEETILSIIGRNAVDKIVIKSDPLADGDTDNDDPENHVETNEVLMNQYYETRSRSDRGRKRRHSYKERNVSDLEEHGGPSSSIERKPTVSADKNAAMDESDSENEASQFLRLEKEKLENSKQTLNSLQTIAAEITRLADVMGHIRDILGLMLGNAYMGPEMLMHIPWAFYHFGLLEKEQIENIKTLINGLHQDIADNKSLEAKMKCVRLSIISLILTHQKQTFNFLKDEIVVGRFRKLLEKSEVKRAIHVGDTKYSVHNLDVNVKLTPEFLSSMKPIFKRLLEHYRVLLYCGQLDQMLPCVFTSEYYRTWQWRGSKQFLNSTRHAYMFNKRLCGYYKTGGSLTEVVLLGGGHMVPYDVPAPAQDMVAQWTNQRAISSQQHEAQAGCTVKRTNTIPYFL